VAGVPDKSDAIGTHKENQIRHTTHRTHHIYPLVATDALDMSMWQISLIHSQPLSLNEQCWDAHAGIADSEQTCAFRDYLLHPGCVRTVPVSDQKSSPVGWNLITHLEYVSSMQSQP
jgi:hypothetical protein